MNSYKANMVVLRQQKFKHHPSIVLAVPSGGYCGKTLMLGEKHSLTDVGFLTIHLLKLELNQVIFLSIVSKKDISNVTSLQ